MKLKTKETNIKKKIKYIRFMNISKYNIKRIKTICIELLLSHRCTYIYIYIHIYIQIYIYNSAQLCYTMARKNYLRNPVKNSEGKRWKTFTKIIYIFKNILMRQKIVDFVQHFYFRWPMKAFYKLLQEQYAND